MQPEIKFQLPKLIICKVEPLLRKEQKIFSYRITVSTQNDKTLMLYENKGLDLSEFIGQKMECLLEITRGKFIYADNKDSTLIFKYQWLKRPFEFLPELIEIKKKTNQDYQEPDLSKNFEDKSNQLLLNWGLNGLNIDIYQAKPVFSSTEGFFLVNEYEFEDDINCLKLNEEVHMKVDEAFLRGIRPCDEQSLLKWKQKEQLRATLPQPEPTQPQSEVKKKRTFFT